MSKKPETAEEFMNRLNADPNFVRMQAEKDARRQRREDEYRKVLDPLLEGLGAIGFHAESMEQLRQRYVPLPKLAVEFLLESLASCEHERLQEWIVRTLGGSSVRFDGRPLVVLYRRTQGEAVRFAILNTIAIIHPHSIDGWLASLSEDSHIWITLTALGFDRSK